MAQNYTRPIQLGDVVVASGMLRRGFMKAFRWHIGCTQGLFIRDRKAGITILISFDHGNNFQGWRVKAGRLTPCCGGSPAQASRILAAVNLW